MADCGNTEGVWRPFWREPDPGRSDDEGDAPARREGVGDEEQLGGEGWV